MTDDELIEAMARAIYERRHRGLKNIWAWDSSGLDDEHPGTRKAIIAEATAALVAIRKTRAVVSRDLPNDTATINRLSAMTIGDPQPVYRAMLAAAITSMEPST